MELFSQQGSYDDEKKSDMKKFRKTCKAQPCNQSWVTAIELYGTRSQQEVFVFEANEVHAAQEVPVHLRS